VDAPHLRPHRTLLLLIPSPDTSSPMQPLTVLRARAVCRVLCWEQASNKTPDALKVTLLEYLGTSQSGSDRLAIIPFLTQRMQHETNDKARSCATLILYLLYAPHLLLSSASCHTSSHPPLHSSFSSFFIQTKASSLRREHIGAGLPSGHPSVVRHRRQCRWEQAGRAEQVRPRCAPTFSSIAFAVHLPPPTSATLDTSFH
jgi:hypothetical protein